MASISSTAICFIACHGGSADHFATYVEVLTKQGYHIQVHASDHALKKFEDRHLKVNAFSLDKLTAEEENNLANQIAKTCSAASVVFTDVGHPFAIKVQKAFATHAEKVTRWAYYDNPEPFVPGGYSATAAEVMLLAQGILFANENLAHTTIYSEKGKAIDFGSRQRVGIGYYPIQQAQAIAKRRESEHDTLRAKILAKNGIEDKGQKIWVYFGGNNEEYFSKAFPAFLSFLPQVDIHNAIIIIQQHPVAKAKNLDGEQLAKFKEKNSLTNVIVSDFSSDDAQVIADAAFYYQTSMGPQFVLIGIPTVQVGHETYEDILVKNQLAPSVTDATQFGKVIHHLDNQQKPPQEIIFKGLGIREDWVERLKRVIHFHNVDVL